MSDIWDLARELGAKIVFFKPDGNVTKDGMYYRDISTVCLNALVSEKRQENVLLHETGHSYYGHQHYSCHAKGWSARQERQANEYMIHQRAEEWLAQYDWEPQYIDYSAFLEYFELDRKHYSLAEEVFTEILVGNKSNHCCLQ
ncbi:ImmA/IrrE family metallo-endopeptidase [Lactococcus taiwanensis]|uniref:ImmA/IrrE family metallo-endopeptidase n=1 Tax=Lactococcus taiwanensis TaxID=1151742 RepID=UPI003519071A